MAEMAPWLAAEQETPSNVAPWLAAGKPAVEEEASAIKDAAKTVGPSLLRGSLAAITAPRGISDLTGAGANWAVNKVAPGSKAADMANQFHNWDSGMGGAFPSYDQIKGEMEKETTGPLYEAKTPFGKGVQTTSEVVPGLLAGGEGALPTLTKAIGAGIGSEGLGEAAHALKGWFPNSVPSWLEPVAHGVGALAGGFAGPSAVRRAITPLPMSDERLATVNALKQANPELVNASSAGQLTESPRVMAVEGRSPNMAGLPQRQEEAYTQGVMRQAGSDGMFDTPGLAQAKARGAELDALQNAHEMNPSQYGLLSQYASTRNVPGSELYKEVGPSKAYQDVVDAIKNGPGGGNPPPASMTGPRFGVMKQELQKAGENAPTTHEGKAIFDLRERTKNAFEKSMPDDEAQRLRDLNKQYSNYMTIKDIPVDVGENTVTPNQVFQKADRGSDLEAHATNASKVMTPLPPRSTEVSDVASLLGSTFGAMSHGGAGYLAGGMPGLVAASGEGALTGLFTAPHYINAAKDVAGRVATRPLVQSYLKNQALRPGNPAFDNDPATIARILMTPPERQAVSDK